MPKKIHDINGYQGEIAALVSSLALAITPYFFIHGYSQKCSPYILNFWKGLISIGIFIVLLLATQQEFFPADQTQTYILLIASGFFGIGLGDTFYFQAFEVLGPRWAVLLETITPTFTGLISFIYFGTTLSILQWVGMIVTGAGIYIVAGKQAEQEKQQKSAKENINQEVEVYQSRLDDENQLQEIHTQENLKYAEERSNTRHTNDQIVEQKDQVLYQGMTKQYIIGLLKGVAFAFCQAFGMVLAHDAAQSGKFTPLETTFVRVLTGQLYVTLIMIFTCDRLHWPSKNTEESFYFLGGIGACSILGIWAQQTSLKFVRPEISQTIIATSPLFSLFIGCLRRDNIHTKDIAGSIISIIGVSMVIWL